MKLELRSTNGQTQDRTLWWSLTALFLGSAALGAYFLIAPALSGGLYYKVGFNRTALEYSPEILPLFIPWGLALVAWRRGLRVPFKFLVGGAIALHLIVLFAPPAMSQDFYQYLFYGRIQAVHGANPYLAVPSHFWRDPWFAWTRWHDQTSVYGPLWMLVTLGVAKAARNSLTLAFLQLKMVVLAIDLTVMALIVRAAKLRSRDHIGDLVGNGKGNSGPAWQEAAGFGLLAFAWNPLVLVSVPLSGAADVVLAAAFLGAVVARHQRRTGLATVILTLAALTKIYAVAALGLHLLLLARERDWRTAARHAAGATGLAALAYAPYWAGWDTFRGLWQAVGYTSFSLVGAIQGLLVPVFRLIGVHPALSAAEVTMRIIIAPLLIGIVVWAIRRVRDEASLWKSVLIILTAYLFLTPWFMYWYILGALALVAALPRNRLTDPILTFSGTSMIATWWIPFAHRLPDLLMQTVQAALRYVPPVMVFRRQGKSLAARSPRPAGSPPRVGSRERQPA